MPCVDDFCGRDCSFMVGEKNFGKAIGECDCSLRSLRLGD
jgi:hypothetical protein